MEKETKILGIVALAIVGLFYWNSKASAKAASDKALSDKAENDKLAAEIAAEKALYDLTYPYQFSISNLSNDSFRVNIKKPEDRGYNLDVYIADTEVTNGKPISVFHIDNNGDDFVDVNGLKPNTGYVVNVDILNYDEEGGVKGILSSLSTTIKTGSYKINRFDDLFGTSINLTDITGFLKQQPQ